MRADLPTLIADHPELSLRSEWIYAILSERRQLMLIFFFLARTAYNLSNVSTSIDEPIGGPNVRPLEVIRTAVQTHMLGIDVLTPRGELPKLVELIRKHCIETHFEVQQPLLDKHLNANLLARRIDPAVPPHAFNAHAEQLQETIGNFCKQKCTPLIENLVTLESLLLLQALDLSSTYYLLCSPDEVLENEAR